MNLGTSVQLRHLFEVVSGATPESGNADYWDGDIAWVTPEDVSQVEGNVINDTRRKLTAAGYASSGTKMAPAGSIVLTKRAPIGQLAILGLEACSNQGCFLLSPREGAEPRFFYYVLSNNVPLLQALGRGSTFMELSTDDLKALRVPKVDYAAQVARAEYLERATARLDALVATKRRQVGLLAEKRKAMIATAVTRGLDPKVKLRDSGVRWLGEIPAHWSAVRVRHLISSLDQGWSPEAENREPTLDEWGVLKLNAVAQGVFDHTAAKTLLARMDPRPDIEVYPGDVLVTRANTPSLVGDACFIVETRPKLMLCDLIYRLRVKPESVDGRFLVNFLVTAGRPHPEMTARGTSNSMVKLSQEHIKDWWVPLPSLDEQRAIVKHIARETAKLDAVCAATERTISLLKERRAALIAAAVTGELDVEGVA